MSYWAMNGAITCAENLERLDRKWDAEAKRLEREIIAELRVFDADDPYYVAEIEALDHVLPIGLAICR
jgi:hypothetical protein